MDPFSVQFCLTAAFCEALHAHNLCVLSFKVADGSLPLRSWLAPRLGNWPDWITTTPGACASKIIGRKMASLHHFTIWSHKSSTCTVSDRSEWPALGLARNLLLALLPKFWLQAFNMQWVNLHICCHWKKISPFFPYNHCWVCSSPGLALVSADP